MTRKKSWVAFALAITLAMVSMVMFFYTLLGVP